MRADTEAAWLEGLDSRTEQDRRDEFWGPDPAPGTPPVVPDPPADPWTEPPF